MNPARMAIRISGTNAAEDRIARRLAAQKPSDTARTRSTSRRSAVKALMVVRPPRLVEIVALTSPAACRTSR